MNIITPQKHQELIKILNELKNIVEEMKRGSTDTKLIWQNEELETWLNFLENHVDREALKSLEVEIGNRFFHNYHVRIEPVNLDKIRLDLFQKFINQLNDALQ